MSFTLDGVTIETTPATMVKLTCGNSALLTGRIDAGEFIYCEDCTREQHGTDAEQAVTCQVVDVFRTEIVPTVEIPGVPTV